MRKVFLISLINAFFIIFLAVFISFKIVKSQNKTKKIIGVIADYEIDKTRDDNIQHLYNKQTLRNRYIENFVKTCNDDSISFVILPISQDQVDRFAETVDGVVFTGGQDVDAKYFGQEKHPTTDEDSIARTEFELAFAKKIIKKKKPVLAICRGVQVINIAFGGDLIQDIPSFIKTDIDHSDFHVGKTNHTVKIERNSLLYKIFNKNQLLVNSGHHQAVNKLGTGFDATAKAPDGIIEAIELKDNDFFLLGVQWHPEHLATEDDAKLIKSFCEAVKNA